MFWLKKWLGGLLMPLPFTLMLIVLGLLLLWFTRRQRLGKPYNLMRLVRATATFDGAARYAAWKVERHTGVAIALTVIVINAAVRLLMPVMY